MARTQLSTCLLFGTLVFGAAVVHIVVAIWGATLLEPFLSQYQVSEFLQITKAGEVVVQRNTRIAGTGRSETAYLNLDGSKLPEAEVSRTGFGDTAHLSLWPKVPRSESNGRSWGIRLAALRDTATPPAYWYLMNPPDTPSHCYLVGYDSVSRQRVGFLGLQGFSPVLPSREDRFSIQPHEWNTWMGNVVSTDVAHWQWHNANEPIWTRFNSYFAGLSEVRLWILSNGMIYELDPLNRQVRELIAAPEAIYLSRSEMERDGRHHSKLLIQNPDALRLIDPVSLAETRFPLMSERPETRGSATFLQTVDNEFVLVTTFSPLRENSEDSVAEIQWFNADGTLARTATRTLKSTSNQEVGNSLVVAAVFPLPLVPLIGLTVAPHFMAWDGDTRGWSERFGEVWSWISGWFLATTFIGFLCAWACRRRELQVFHNASWWWPVTVGCLGWFGWIGYINLRPLPAKLPAGGYLPDHPDPALPTGSEIFA